MSGNIIYELPKYSTPLPPLFLTYLQRNLVTSLTYKLNHLLSNFKVIEGLSISILRKEPLTLFISAGKIYIEMEVEDVPNSQFTREKEGYVFDVSSKTIVIPNSESLYLIGVNIHLREEDNYKNPLQGGNVLGSLGAKRLIYTTQITINEDSFTIGYVTKDLDIQHINSKGVVSTHRVVTPLSIPYLDLYKKDIGNYVARGFSLSVSPTSFILSPGVVYLQGERLFIPKPTILSKPLNFSSLTIGVSSLNQITLSIEGRSIQDSSLYPIGEYLTTEENEEIYIDREEDGISSKVYIYQEGRSGVYIKPPLIVNLYKITRIKGIEEVEEYPIFMPSNKELRNMQEGIREIERRMTLVLDKLNLLEQKEDSNISKYIIISSFNLENSDVNYPGYSNTFNSKSLFPSTIYTSYILPALGSQSNLYSYYLGQEEITVYPIWYETRTYTYPDVNDYYYPIKLNPTHLIRIEELRYLLLIFNEALAVSIHKDLEISDIPLVGSSLDRRTYTGKLIALVGDKPNTLKINEVNYTKGFNLILGQGSISQPLFFPNIIITNKIYIRINNPTLVLVTKDYLGNPDLSEVLAWGYSPGNSQYIELNRPLELGGRFHIILSGESIPINNSLSYEETKEYIDRGVWLQRGFKVALRMNQIEYRSSNTEAKVRIDSVNPFNIMELKGSRRGSYIYETGLETGVKNEIGEIELGDEVKGIGLTLSLKRGEYIDRVREYIDLGYRSKEINWISINYSLTQVYKGLDVYIEGEVELYFSSNYGQAWTKIPKREEGIYSITDLSSTVPYEGVNTTTTLMRNNLKLRVKTEHRIEGLRVKLSY